MPRPLMPLVVLLVAVSLSGETRSQTYTLTSVADTTINASSWSYSNGSGSAMFAGFPNAASERRALVRFDLTSLPAGACITSVRLDLGLTGTSAPSSEVTVHRVLSDWGEGASVAPMGQGIGAPAAPGDATWSHRIWPTTPWNTNGGDFVAVASASQNVVASSRSWSSPGLLSDVLLWQSTPATNFGWMIRSNSFHGHSAKRFGTRESSLPPRLVVSCSPLAHVDYSDYGCPQNFGLSPELTSSRPVLGGGFWLRLFNNPGSSTLVFLSQDFGFSNLVMLPSGYCSTHINTASAIQLITAGLSPLGPFSGTTLMQMTLPNDPALAGGTVALQALVEDSSGQTVALSNAIRLRFGY